MKCTHVPLPQGGFAIVCGSKKTLVRPQRCGTCARPSMFLCDWRIAHDRTCDALMCERHATQVAPGKHLCPLHNAEWEKRKAAKEAARKQQQSS